MNWKQKLTKVEHKHLREHNINTLRDLKEMRAKQKALALRTTCKVCEIIAIKVGAE